METQGDSSINPQRIIIVWLVLSVIADLAIIFLLGPHMPPGSASAQADEQRKTNIVLAVVLAPIALAVWTYFAMALTSFRQRGEFRDGPPIQGDSRLQGYWIVGTLLIVLCLAAYGTYALYATTSSAAGSGGGQGPTLISAAPANALQVQVISQQWAFTFRYPQYGDVETTQLAVQANRTVVFHVTSIDVIHSFWAYDLGIKVDAVPGADNVADTTPNHPGTFTIRCAELCGVWHGEMHSTGLVLTKSGFASWIAQQRRQARPVLKHLPPFRSVYYPDPTERAG